MVTAIVGGLKHKPISQKHYRQKPYFISALILALAIFPFPGSLMRPVQAIDGRDPDQIDHVSRYIRDLNSCDLTVGNLLLIKDKFINLNHFNKKSHDVNNLPNKEQKKVENVDALKEQALEKGKQLENEINSIATQREFLYKNSPSTTGKKYEYMEGYELLLLTSCRLGALQKEDYKLYDHCEALRTLLLKALENTLKISIPLAVFGCEEMYIRFLKGVLIYRPEKNSDEGMRILPINKLDHPLESTFDLSECGHTGKFVSISTGYRKQHKPENIGKIEVWLAPRFLVEKELKTRTPYGYAEASYFEPIMPDWRKEAPVGIFWTRGGWQSANDLGMYYLTTETMDNLSKLNLREHLGNSVSQKEYHIRNLWKYLPFDMFSFRF